MRVLFIVRHLPPALDAIADYTVHLVKALVRLGVTVEILASRGASGREGGPRVRACVTNWTWRAIPQIVIETWRARAELVNWQYTPFLYGKRGIALSFALLPLLLRVVVRAKVVVTSHEVYFPFRLYREFGARALIWGVVQRAELFLIGLGSHGLVVTTGRRARDLQRLFSWKRDMVRRIPVGANVLPATEANGRRTTVRAAIGATDDTAVLGIFSTLTEHRSLVPVVRAVAILAPKRDVRLLCLGKINRDTRVWQEAMALADHLGIGSLIYAPGVQSPQDLSAAFQALDIYLALYDDGASGVRTTLITALAHGLPVISTRGAATDPDWFVEEENIMFLEMIEPNALADLVLRVLEDRGLRQRLRDGARRSYRERFSWDVIGAEQLHLMRQLVGLRSGAGGRTG